MTAGKQLDATVLEMDNDHVIEQICTRLRSILSREVGRRGFVVAMSGGIDSSVSAALCRFVGWLVSYTLKPTPSLP